MAFWAAQAKNASLLEINVRANSLGQKGALGIAKGLFKNNALAVLHLRYNDIGDYGAKALAATLMHNTTLTEIDVARNRIGFEGTEALMKSLTHNQTLRHLNLQRNDVSDQGGLALGIVLKVNTSVTHLDIMDCRVGDIGAVSIFESLGGIYYTYARHAEGKVKRRKIPTMNNSIRYYSSSGTPLGAFGCGTSTPKMYALVESNDILILVNTICSSPPIVVFRMTGSSPKTRAGT